MKLWRLVSPILIVLMLITPYVAVAELQAEIPQNELLSEFDTFAESEPITDTPVPAAASSSFAIQSSAPPAETNDVSVQADFDPATVHWYTSDTGNTFTAIPTIVDDSDWPVVEVSVLNPNAYWLSIDVWSDPGTEIVEHISLAANIGVIAPGEDATYKVLFSDLADSSITFHVNSTLMMVPISGGPGGGWYTILDFVLRFGTVGAVDLSMVQDSFTYITAAWDAFRSTPVCMSALNSIGAGQFLGVGIFAIAGDLYNCFTSETVTSAIEDLIHDAFESAGLEFALGNRFGFITGIRDIIVMLWQMGSGAISAEITFESLRHDFSTLRVHQVNEEGDPVLGGCYLVREAVGGTETSLGSNCDDNDGALDGTISLITRPGYLAELRNFYPAAGYVVPPDQDVQLITNEVVEVNIVLLRSGDLTVSVVDENDDPVTGTCFRLAPFASGHDSVACDHSDGESDGHVTFDMFAPGEYFLEQTVAQWNYTSAEIQVITVEKDVPLPITVINSYTEDGSLVVNLSGEDGSLPLGACFNVFTTDTNSPAWVARLCDSDSGVLQMDDIHYGSYVLIQEKDTTPDGYLPAYDTYFAIFGGQETVLNIKNLMPSDLRIRSVDPHGSLVAHSCFTLTERATGDIGEEYCDTNGDGTILIENLRSGEYLIRQTKESSSDYAAALDIPVTLSPQEEVVVDMSLQYLSTLIINSQNENGDTLTGICYALAKYTGIGDRQTSVGSSCDEADGEIDGNIRFERLEPGDYSFGQGQVTEESLPTMYQPVETTDIEIPVATDVVEVPAVHAAAGKLVVTTVDGGTDEPITAEYHIYENDGGSTGRLVEKASSNVYSGILEATVDHLPPGDYILTQFKARWADVFPMEEHISFSISAGEVTTISVENVPWPSLTIMSESEAGELLPGACYYSYAIFGNNDEVCDSDDGADDGLTFVPRVTPTMGYVTQSQAPVGYEIQPDTYVRIPEEPGERELVITQFRGGSVLITTLDEETGAPIEACYSLYKMDGVLGEQFLENECSPEGSTDPAQFDLLQPGEYSVGQYKPLNKFRVFTWEDRVPFTIEGDEQQSVVVHNKPWPTLQALSVDEEGIEVLESCYLLKEVSQPYDSWMNCDGDDGDVDGRVHFQRLQPYRTYRLVAQTVPDGLAYPAPIELTGPSEPGLAQRSFVFAPEGTLLINTLDAGTNTPLNSCYYIHFANGDRRGELFERPDSPCFEYDEHQRRIDNLPAGDYFLHQRSSDSGVFATEDIPFTISAGGVTRITVLKEPWPTLTIQSIGESNNLIPGACYNILYEHQLGVMIPEKRCDGDDGADDGTTTFSRLDPRRYEIEQTVVPLGHARANLSEDIVIPNAPGDISLTVGHLPGGSVVIHREGIGSTLFYYYVYVDPGENDLGEPVAETYRGADYRVNGLRPGYYILKEYNSNNPVPDIAFEVVGGQDSIIWIGATEEEREISYSLSWPPAVHKHEELNISVFAQLNDGSTPDLEGYLFAFDCGNGYGEPTPSSEGECIFTEVGETTIKVQISRPSSDPIELTATVKVLASEGESGLTGSLEIKSVYSGDQPLNISCFDLHRDDGDGTPGELIENRCEIYEATTFPDLEPGDYILSVSQTPDGFITPVPLLVTINTDTTASFSVIFDADVEATPAEITLSVSEGEPGWTVRVQGSDFAPGEEVDIRWGDATGELLETISATENGEIDTIVTVPLDADLGGADIVAIGASSEATAAFTVTSPAASTLRLSPNTGPTGEYTGVYGTGFLPGERVDIRWQSDSGILIGYLTVKPDGTFIGRITTRSGPPGSNRVFALGLTSDKSAMAWYQIISSSPTMSLSTNTNLTQSGDVITITGSGYEPGESVEIRWISQTGLLRGIVTASPFGTFVGRISIPDAPNRNYQIFATGVDSERYSSVVHQVRNFVPAGSSTVSPASGSTGSVVTVSGNGFAAHEVVEIRWGGINGTLIGIVTSNADGTYSGRVTTRSSGPGGVEIVAVGRSSYHYNAATYIVTANATSGVLNVSHLQVRGGYVIMTNGTGWTPGETLELRWDGTDGRLLGRVTVRSDGTWSGRITIPVTATVGSYRLFATTPSGFTSVSMTVFDTSILSLMEIDELYTTPTPEIIGTPTVEPTKSPIGTPIAVVTEELTDEVPVGTPAVDEAKKPTEEIPVGTPDVKPAGESPEDRPVGTPTVESPNGTPSVDDGLNVETDDDSIVETAVPNPAAGDGGSSDDPEIVATPTETPTGTPTVDDGLVEEPDEDSSGDVIPVATPTETPTADAGLIDEADDDPTGEDVVTTPEAGEADSADEVEVVETPPVTPTPTPTPVMEPETILVVDQHGAPIPAACVGITNSVTYEALTACDQSADGVTDVLADGRLHVLPGVETGTYLIELRDLPSDVVHQEPRLYDLNGSDGVDVRIVLERIPPTPVPTESPEVTPESTEPAQDVVGIEPEPTEPAQVEEPLPPLEDEAMVEASEPPSGEEPVELSTIPASIEEPLPADEPESESTEEPAA